MRALHFVKTADGALWAAQLCRELVRKGAEVHAVLPSLEGRAIPQWRESGAVLHCLEADWPASKPWRVPALARGIRDLVERVRPDILQTYHVGPTLLVRHALGKIHSIPRLFWVAGPLHLENPIFRRWEIGWAGPRDRWICTSRCIRSLYQKAGISDDRLFVSYAGMDVGGYATERSGQLRESLGIEPDALVVGNVSYIYGPKYHLGQTVGLKCHEDMMEALAIVMKRRPEVRGLLLGGPWVGAEGYAAKLKQRAERLGILMPGYLPWADVRKIWPEFDLAIHVPLSENCGGALEPLLCGVPVIAGDVGGLPELVIPSHTGRLVPIRKPGILADRILEALGNLPREQNLARQGQALVRRMFDIGRTAEEIFGIYRHILQGVERPGEFDPWKFAGAAV